ncbi:MAG: monovalent cation/H(+) antiporter subunit G [Halobacteriota archaeon]
MIETARSVLVIVLLAGGLFFTLVSTTGVIRLPDVYARAHTASQADTLGAGFAIAGVAVAMGVTTETIVALLLLVVIFVTNPTAAHAIARAAYETGVPPWGRTDGGEHD